MNEYRIKLTWDSEAYVWFATSEDVPGLVMESGSCDALIERVKYTVPELLELNGDARERVDLCFVSERRDVVMVNP